jgi:hypothetical protein
MASLSFAFYGICTGSEAMANFVLMLERCFSTYADKCICICIKRIGGSGITGNRYQE